MKALCTLLLLVAVSFARVAEAKGNDIVVIYWKVPSRELTADEAVANDDIYFYHYKIYEFLQAKHPEVQVVFSDRRVVKLEHGTLHLPRIASGFGFYLRRLGSKPLVIEEPLETSDFVCRAVKYFRWNESECAE